jgi:hypothetical protein
VLGEPAERFGPRARLGMFQSGDSLRVIFYLRECIERSAC